MRDDRDETAAARPDDHEARCRAIDPERSFIVRAPAGSGKTTLLIRRYLVLLARVAQPEEILCMTFTRKAAAEMRNRVLAALQRADAGEPGGDATADALARAALDHARVRGWNLPQHPSRLQFHTIDGFCGRLVRQLPRGSGFGAMPEVESLSSMLYRKAAADAMARMDDGDEPAARAARTVLGYLDNDYERVRKLVVAMLGSRDQWLRLTVRRGDAGERETLERCWHDVVTHGLRRVRGVLASNAALAGELVSCAAMAAERLHGMGVHSPISACRDLVDLPPAEPGALPQWQGIAALLLTKEGILRKSRGVTKHIGFPPDTRDDAAAKQRMVRLLDALGDGGKNFGGVLMDDLHAVRALPPPKYTEEQWRVLGALLTLLKEAAACLNLDIGASGRCDYIALSSRACAALGTEDDPTDLALALDYKLQHILVDEFQDTSQSQMELLTLLTAGWDGSDRRTLFLVGDPMQSIYGFRRADVGIYLETVARGLGHVPLKPLTLTANFRAQRPLVEWVNRVFAVAMPSRPDAGLGAVEFSTSTVSRDDDAEARVCVHAAWDGAAPGEAFEVAAVAREERERDGRATIAILARSRSHLPAILSALTDAGVPYQEIGLDPLGERPAVRDVLALTRALLHSADRTAWLSVLRAPWCGLALGDLEVVAAAGVEPWERLRDSAALAGLSRTGRERVARIVPALEWALAHRGRLAPARWVENAWLHLGGAELVTEEDWPDVRVYFEQLARLCESTGLRDYDALHESLRELRSVAGRRDGAVDTTSSPVQVTTMHGVKGLEFDVVLIPGLGRRPKADEHKLLLWNDRKADGEAMPGLLIAPLHVSNGEDAGEGGGGDVDGGSSGDDAGEESGGGEMYDYLCSFLAKKQRLEDARLLYVACTRAKLRLHLFSTVKAARDGAMRTPEHGSLLSHLWESCRNDIQDKLHAGRRDGDAPAVASRMAEASRMVEAHSRLWRAPDGWRAPASGIAIPTLPVPGDVPEAGAGIGTPMFDWAGQSARLTGILVHRMLCLIAEQGLRGWNGERVRGCRAAWAAELEARGLEPDTIERVVDDIEKAVRFSLDDSRGKWILDDAHRNARNEYDISGVVDGRPVRGVLDRTMIDADGVRWIIDYKAGIHRGGGADLERFLDNELERYRSQLEGYAAMMSRMTRDPIRLGLYFPLAKGWREWTWRGEEERA